MMSCHSDLFPFLFDVMKDKEKTINTHVWVAERTDLSFSEKFVYSIYSKETFDEECGYCYLTNKEIADKLGC